MLTYLLIAVITAMLVAPFAFGLGGVLGQSKLSDQATAMASLVEATRATRTFLDHHRPLSRSQIVSSEELIRLREATDAAVDTLRAVHVTDDNRPLGRVHVDNNAVRSFV